MELGSPVGQPGGLRHTPVCVLTRKGMAYSFLYPQCRSDNLHDSPARVVFFAHFINKDTRLREVKCCSLVSR